MPAVCYAACYCPMLRRALVDVVSIEPLMYLCCAYNTIVYMVVSRGFNREFKNCSKLLCHKCYGKLIGMNDIQEKLAGLQSKGWTLAAIADELEVTVNAAEKWKAGDTYPRNSKGVLLVLDVLAKRKRIPKQRRYAPGSRTRTTDEG